MGEYFEGKKLGTCENLYYATFEQIKKLEADKYLNPDHGFRYRFPFSDEQEIEIGTYEDFDRGVLFSIEANLGIEITHDKLSIYAQNLPTTKRFYNSGLLGKVDCPNQNDTLLYFEVVQQKQVNGELRTIARCPICGQLCQLSKEEVDILAKKALSLGEQYESEFTTLQIGIIAEMVIGYK